MRRLHDDGSSFGGPGLGFEGKQQSPFATPALHLDAAGDEAGQEISAQAAAIRFRAGRRFDFDSGQPCQLGLLAGRFRLAE